MRITIPSSIRRQRPGSAARAWSAALRACRTRPILLSQRPRARQVQGHASPLERVMRRTASPAMRSFSTHMHLLALRSGGAIRRTAPVAVRQARNPVPPARGMRLWLPALVTRHAPPQPRSGLPGRPIGERAVHAASGPLPLRLAVTRMYRGQSAARIEMVMVRQPAPATEASADNRAASAPPVDGRAGALAPRFATPAPPLVLPAQELSRLTDHVISQLDRRVLSWHERNGRI